jgi:hypothetical protein
VATPGYSKPLPLENHVRVVAIMPDLQRVSFYSATDFLYDDFTVVSTKQPRNLRRNFNYKVLGIKANSGWSWLSNDFNAWRSWLRHENRKQNLEQTL